MKNKINIFKFGIMDGEVDPSLELDDYIQAMKEIDVYQKPIIKSTFKMQSEASLVLVVDKNANITKSLKNRDADTSYIPNLSDVLVYMQTTPDLKILVLDENYYVFSSNFDVTPYVWNN